MIPDDRKYSQEHEWVQVEGDIGPLGQLLGVQSTEAGVDGLPGIDADDLAPVL